MKLIDEMADASKRCDFAGWERARKAFLALIDGAKANYDRAQAHDEAVHAEAVAYWALSELHADNLDGLLQPGAYAQVRFEPPSDPMSCAFRRARWCFASTA